MIIKNKIKFLIFSMIILPEIIFADDLNPLQITSIEELIGSILSGLTYILTPIIALAIIYSGFLFISAQGDSSKLEKARTAFAYSLVGAALILGANMIFSVVLSSINKVIQ